MFRNSLILILLCVGIVRAELPNTVTDPAIKEVVELLDSKVTKAQKNFANFSNTSSTTTFAGWIDIGRQAQIVNGCSGCTLITATCTTGYTILYGGCAADTGTPVLKVNYASSPTVWTCASTGSTNLTAYVTCARIK